MRLERDHDAVAAAGALAVERPADPDVALAAGQVLVLEPRRIAARLAAGVLYSRMYRRAAARSSTGTPGAGHWVPYSAGLATIAVALLSPLEVELTMVEDGLAAIDAWRAAPFDLILMDMSLPVMDGWEATRQLKATAETKMIPVIALTAHAMAGDQQKAMQAGADDYDTKPIDLKRLIAKMEALLNK